MKERLKKMFWISIGSSILFILLGIFLFMKPETTIASISYILAVILFLVGIFAIVDFFRSKDEKKFVQMDLVYGAVSILAGLLLLLHPVALATFIPIILGIWIVISSASKIQYSMLLKASNRKAWLVTLIISLLMMLFGAIIVFNPFAGALVLTQLIGIFMMTYAIVELVQVIVIRKNMKTLIDDLK